MRKIGFILILTALLACGVYAGYESKITGNIKPAMGWVVSIVGVLAAVVGFVVIRNNKEEKSKMAKIGELWNEGMQASESKKHFEAAAKFEMIIEKYGYESAILYSNCGSSLGQYSDLKGGDKKSLEDAINKFKKAIEIEPDYCDAYIGCGIALFKLSALNNDSEEKTLLEEAEDKLFKAEKIEGGSGAYSIACVRCRLGDIEGCKNWLKIGEEKGGLETRDHAMKDDDLAKVRDEDWFKELGWKVSK